MKLDRLAVALAALAVAAGPALAEAPVSPPAAAPLASAAPVASAITPALVAPPVPAVIRILEGTEFPVRLEDSLSSKSAVEGDRFTVSLTEDVKLADGTVLRAGYRGVGEVIDARKSGMLGKTGKLNVRLNYLKIGDQRVRLRASRAVQGGHNTGAQVGTLLLIWPVMPFIKGKSTQINKGTVLTAFADQDVVLETPLPPPPAGY